MLETQSLPRAINEMLILAAVQGAAKHGYQIALEIEERTGGYFSFNHGTLYPILHHLEKEGLIDGTWDTGSGRRKKEYALTPAGRVHLATRFGEWNELNARLAAFVAELTPLRASTAANQR